MAREVATATAGSGSVAFNCLLDASAKLVKAGTSVAREQPYRWLAGKLGMGTWAGTPPY